ncbi:PTS system, mannitol-specific IIA component [Williamsoniiplasma somnilux]|uniref:PTS system, mannitol-specific IIA component n=1 Tax=Williamsoniiplasma somnilux TaxID=215578 RepID=A0A2K8NXY9_9MOLU|nr:helix-turn-helix domain-containing protein [Williamsoniiplasma somnilux]ATZ18689.1 PTS system, mannitol-specific IIA component [Williamsoniiplasma somnilux]
MLTNERNVQILYLLLNIQKVNVLDLSKYLSVSEKTILRSVETLNNKLKKFSCQIMFEKNDVFFKGNSKDIFKKFYSFEENDIFTTYERQIYILNLFLNKDSEEKITLNNIALNIDFPITTIKKDISSLNLRLNQKGEELISSKNDGLILKQMNESQIIDLYLNLILNQIITRQGKTIIKNMSIEPIFNPYIYRNLVANWNIDLFNKIFNSLIIVKTQKNLNNSDYEIIYLSLYITFWLNHSRNLKLITILKKSESINLDEIMDQIYIKDNKKILLSNFYENFDNDNNLVNRIVSELTLKINALFMDEVFLNDEAILNIKNHLSRNIKNNSFQVHDKFINDFHVQGIANYIKDFNEIWLVTKEVLDKFLKQENVNDILTYEVFLYIMVWFDAMIYDYKLTIKTVCIGGMGQSAMMSHHIKTIYKNALIEPKPYAMLTKEDYINSDLIISALEIDHKNYDNILNLPFMSVINNKELIHKKLSKIIYKKILVNK